MSIVIPCYNEEENIPLLLKRFGEVIEGNDIEVWLVDNGSTDNSPEVIKNLLPQYPFARTVRVEVNQGYGYGIVQGLKACGGDLTGWTHADMQTDPGDVVKAYKIAVKSDGKVYVKGNRKGRPLFDQFFTSGMSLFETLYMGVKLYDVNAQPNIFGREFFESWQEPPKDFALDLYALYMAQKKGFTIKRFDVIFPERIHGESHWNNGSLKAKWKFIKRTLDFSVKLKKQGIR